jgi:hypothetical protein
MIPKGCVSINKPSKTDEFQSTIIPPDAPTEGEKVKQSNLLGANFLKKRQSTVSHLVS